MIHFAPRLYRHEDDINECLCILITDSFCKEAQIIAQPVVQLFWKFYINNGQPQYTWFECMEEIDAKI